MANAMTKLKSFFRVFFKFTIPFFIVFSFHNRLFGAFELPFHRPVSNRFRSVKQNETPEASGVGRPWELPVALLQLFPENFPTMFKNICTYFTISQGIVKGFVGVFDK